MMLVDPEVLRTLASQTDAASSTISSAGVGNKTTSAADVLPGSTTQWSARVGEHFAQMATKLADNVTKMGQAVRGAGDAFEVTDDALASDFDGLF
ncbi:MAG: type VII secretion target [Mycobacterium sp.]